MSNKKEITRIKAVWYIISNTCFQFSNNITRIFTQFFTHMYFHTCFQTTKHMFLSAKHPLNLLRLFNFLFLNPPICKVNILLTTEILEKVTPYHKETVSHLFIYIQEKKRVWQKICWFNTQTKTNTNHTNDPSEFWATNALRINRDRVFVFFTWFPRPSIIYLRHPTQCSAPILSIVTKNFCNIYTISTPSLQKTKISKWIAKRNLDASKY